MGNGFCQAKVLMVSVIRRLESLRIFSMAVSAYSKGGLRQLPTLQSNNSSIPVTLLKNNLRP
jgi:hypothetical protein